MNRTITILYFAWVRERLGKDQEIVDLPDELVTVADLIAHLRESSADHREVLENLEKLRFALDQDFVLLDRTIGSAKELAIFPPVTGG